MRDQQCYRANADKYKEDAREAYESSAERNFKGPEAWAERLIVQSLSTCI